MSYDTEDAAAWDQYKALERERDKLREEVERLRSSLRAYIAHVHQGVPLVLTNENTQV